MGCVWSSDAQAQPPLQKPKEVFHYPKKNNLEIKVKCGKKLVPITPGTSAEAEILEYSLPPGVPYWFEAFNRGRTKCDLKTFIDDKQVNYQRIAAGQGITISTPYNINQAFILVSHKTKSVDPKITTDNNKPMNGIVKFIATFEDEKNMKAEVRLIGNNATLTSAEAFNNQKIIDGYEPDAARGHYGASTQLGGASSNYNDQSFVEPIVNIDRSLDTTIVIRLLAFDP